MCNGVGLSCTVKTTETEVHVYGFYMKYPDTNIHFLVYNEGLSYIINCDIHLFTS